MLLPQDGDTLQVTQLTVDDAVSQQEEDNMTDWQLGRLCKNQLGAKKGMHLLFAARARVGSG